MNPAEMTIQDLGILAIDLINMEFDLKRCYYSLNYSGYLLREGSEEGSRELEEIHPDLSEEERRKRLRRYLKALLEKLN